MKLTRRNLATALVSAAAAGSRQQPQPAAAPKTICKAARDRMQGERCRARSPSRNPHGHRAGLPVQSLRSIMASIGNDIFFATHPGTERPSQGKANSPPKTWRAPSPNGCSSSARATTRWRCRCTRRPCARPRRSIRSSSASAIAARCKAFRTASRICSATPDSPPPGAPSPTPARSSITTPR